MTKFDSDAFLADWRTLSTFGAVEGTSGVDRQAATAADGEQRRWFAGLLEQHGFRVHRDAIGNLFGLRELVPGAPYVLTGSHLDSQPTAGRFDGAYGVLASAYAAFRTVDQLQREGRAPVFNIAVVDWFNEEGSRFAPSMMGSAVFTDKLPLHDALETRDRAGVRVVDALDALNERGTANSPDVACYAEIHVQQSRSMEEGGVSIGLVTSTWAAHKTYYDVIGEQAHTGSTVMADRHDALLGAAKIVVATRQLADQFPDGALHTSVGEFDVYPNSPVVVASRVRLLVDLRSADEATLAKASRMLTDAITRIAKDVRVTVEPGAHHSWNRNPYPAAGVTLARTLAEELGLSHQEVYTVAGHDSTNLKDIVPTVMLFVPSVDGISHNVREHTDDTDLVNGLDHLTALVARLADGALGRRCL